jgi:hypothetical protein
MKIILSLVSLSAAVIVQGQPAGPLGVPVPASVTITRQPGVPAIGAYDLDFTYNPNQVAVTLLTFPVPGGLDLGVAGSVSFADNYEDPLGVWHWRIGEVSLEDTSLLTGLQPSFFPIATFNVDGPPSLLHFTAGVIASAEGYALTFENIQGTDFVVPENRHFALLSAVGLLGFGLYRLRCKQRQPTEGRGWVAPIQR